MILRSYSFLNHCLRELSQLGFRLFHARVRLWVSTNHNNWTARFFVSDNLGSTLRSLKALANEDTLLRTHCCRHKCFPVCPRAQHLLRTQILCPGHKNVSDSVQKHSVFATNVSQFAQPKKHHGQQCVRNNVSSFTRALKQTTTTMGTRTSPNKRFNEQNNSCARAL